MTLVEELEKIVTIAENMPRVYEAGKRDEYDSFWDVYQQNGNQIFYSYAFYYWRNEAYNPKYPIYCNGNNTANQMFAYSKITDTKVDITIYSATSSQVFYNSKIQTIKKLKVNRDTSFLNWFNSADSIKDLTIEGVIGVNNFNIQWSSSLSKKSLLSIINALEDKTADTSGTEWRIKIGSVNLAKLTLDERAIAENKGWMVS